MDNPITNALGVGRVQFVADKLVAAAHLFVGGDLNLADSESVVREKLRIARIDARAKIAAAAVTASGAVFVTLIKSTTLIILSGIGFAALTVMLLVVSGYASWLISLLDRILMASPADKVVLPTVAAGGGASNPTGAAVVGALTANLLAGQAVNAFARGVVVSATITTCGGISAYIVAETLREGSTGPVIVTPSNGSVTHDDDGAADGGDGGRGVRLQSGHGEPCSVKLLVTRGQFPGANPASHEDSEYLAGKLLDLDGPLRRCFLKTRHEHIEVFFKFQEGALYTVPRPADLPGARENEVEVMSVEDEVVFGASAKEWLGDGTIDPSGRCVRAELGSTPWKKLRSLDKLPDFWLTV